MKYTEEAVLFSCHGDTLLGIVAKPEVTAETGVIVVVGGPQYRAGSHRQFVLLSRVLATAGYPVLRFDYRGMGDSEGQQRGFRSVSSDIAAAIDTLQRCVPSVRHVALWGLCDGASAALLYRFDTQDPRVSTLCLLNPWIRSETSFARTQIKHYYTQRLVEKEFWTKLFKGKVGHKAISELLRSVQLAVAGRMHSAPRACAPDWTTATPLPYQQRMAQAWDNFTGNILLLLSGDDYTAKEFSEYTRNNPAWKKSMKHPSLTRCELPGADHTFSSATYRAQVEDLTLRLGLPRSGQSH
ncbi:MAG: hydrolase 1, exosortase A system-associated [Burkholderiales bacterium RIFCSPLOWO2_12_FULL_61_40]|nr:MAG: hydrolase 1, exosortase A system-associated [Burkholderiales bacterium RIFCSPLOWO2_12_FULL_61_40]